MKGGSQNVIEEKPDLGNIEPDDISSNERAKVLPWHTGEAKHSAIWICAPFLVFSKGGGGSAKKGGGEAKEYWGSIACVICAGVVDELLGIIKDSKLIWPKADPWEATRVYDLNDIVVYGQRAWVWTEKTLKSTKGVPPPQEPIGWQIYRVVRTQVDQNPYPIAISGDVVGGIDFYWGTRDQVLMPWPGPTHPLEPPHPRWFFKVSMFNPPYRNQCFALLWNFNFGNERQQAPNMEFLVRRTPQPGSPVNSPMTPQALALDPDGQANPVPSEAELMTNPVFGIGLDPERLSPEVTKEADALRLLQPQTYISFLLDKGTTLRRVISDTVSYRDGWWRFDDTGHFVTGRFPQEKPEITIENSVDDSVALEEIDIEEHDWAEVATEVVVTFTSAILAYKTDARKAVSGYARQITHEPRTKLLERPFFTRSDQAAQYAAEWLRSFTEPYFSGSVKVRPERANGILPGTLFWLTHEQLKVQILCRCLSRTLATPPAIGITIEFESDRRLTPISYQATPTETPEVPNVAAEVIELQQIVQPPPALVSNDPNRIMVLAARTDPLTVRMKVWMQQDELASGYQLGAPQEAFAVYGTIAKTYAADLPAPGTTPPDDLSGNLVIDVDPATVDSDLARMQQPQTVDSVNDNQVIVWLLPVGNPKGFEICTVISMELKGSSYKLKVRRARYGTPQKAFAVGDRAFIVYRKDLVAYSHEAISAYIQLGATVNFKLQAINATGNETDLATVDFIPYTFSANPP